MSIAEVIRRLDAEQQRAQDAVNLRNAQLNYEKTMILLRALKQGEMSLDDIALTGDGWTLITRPEPEIVIVSEDASEAA